MKPILSLLSLLVLFSCSKQKKETLPTHSDTPAMEVMEAPAALPGSASQSRQANNAPTQAGTWRYEKRVDRTGNTIHKASLTASNTLQFPYPYTGGSTATLTIRKGAGDTYVYLEASNGQFNRSFQSGSARVRFDNSLPVTYTLSAAENGRANIVFFDAGRTLIDRISTSRTAVIEVRFPSQPVQTIKFRTAGLQWNP